MADDKIGSLRAVHAELPEEFVLTRTLARNLIASYEAGTASWRDVVVDLVGTTVAIERRVLTLDAAQNLHGTSGSA